MSELRAVLFDLDNTLYPEHDFVRSGFAAVAHYLALRFHLDPARLLDEQMSLFHRYGRGQVFDRLLESLGRHSADLVRTLLFIYRSHPPDIRLFDDVEPVLAALRERGLRLGIVTNGRASVQRNKVKALGLERWCDPIICCDELGEDSWKPAEAPYRVALELLGVGAAQTLFVGDDAECDIVGPARLGMRTIQLIRWPGQQQPCDRAELVLDSLERLPAVVSASAAAA